MASLSFCKVEGLGNNFILLDCLDLESDALAQRLACVREQAPRLCDRYRGIGADGLLVVTPALGIASCDAAMIVINADGSRPEMCGNGLRCVAAHVAKRRGHARGEGFSIETDAGALRCAIEAREDGQIGVQVQMGTARLLGESRPDAGHGRGFFGVSTGNPHAVAFVDASEDPRQLAFEQGPAIELDAVYQPAKTNVEFARIEGPRSIELWVWERGVGITRACGTGACATAVAAVERALVPRHEAIAVRLPGGTLEICVGANSSMQMSGPAREVFRGAIEIEGA